MAATRLIDQNVPRHSAFLPSQTKKKKKPFLSALLQHSFCLPFHFNVHYYLSEPVAVPLNCVVYFHLLLGCAAFRSILGGCISICGRTICEQTFFYSFAALFQLDCFLHRLNDVNGDRNVVTVFLFWRKEKIAGSFLRAFNSGFII